MVARTIIVTILVSLWAWLAQGKDTRFVSPISPLVAPVSYLPTPAPTPVPVPPTPTPAPTPVPVPPTPTPASAYLPLVWGQP